MKVINQDSEVPTGFRAVLKIDTSWKHVTCPWCFTRMLGYRSKRRYNLTGVPHSSSMHLEEISPWKSWLDESRHQQVHSRIYTDRTPINFATYRWRICLFDGFSLVFDPLELEIVGVRLNFEN